MSTIIVEDYVMQEARNIVDDVYNPLKGFISKKDFEHVLDDMRLADGSLWTIPIILDISKEEKDKITSDKFFITDKQGKKFKISDISFYKVNRDEAAIKLYGTNDKQHPGVAQLYNLKEYFVGGKVETVTGNEFLNKNVYCRSPKKLRKIFKKRKWSHIAAFQTRNPPHRSHEFLQKQALQQTDGLLIQPIVGPKKRGDIKDEYILKAYDLLIKKYFPQQKVFLATFDSFMRYAGPREAIFHAQVRKNFGCTHMIIGRDHAGVGGYYSSYSAHNIFNKFSEKELGIKILKYNNAFFCKKCNKVVLEGTCNHAKREKVYLSGTELRRRLLKNEFISNQFMREGIVKFLRESDNIFIA